jgi:hypothetical protein
MLDAVAGLEFVFVLAEDDVRALFRFVGEDNAFGEPSLSTLSLPTRNRTSPPAVSLSRIQSSLGYVSVETTDRISAATSSG